MTESTTLSDRVCASLARLGAAPFTGVVAVSGGPDSMALLLALLELRPVASPPPLIIAHVNHQLRGLESDADETFVRSLHADLTSRGIANLDLRCERIDTASRACEAKDNLESVARQLRYQCLAHTAQDAGLPWVATGHTADDQAETVLHRLLRGTGLRGLGGIPERRRLANGVEVIRPLLHVSRTEVLAYLKAHGQAFRQDSSNESLRFTRNRIRHELLPLLAREYNPAIVSLLCRLAEQAAEVQAIHETAAAELLRQTERPRAGTTVILDGSVLKGAARHLLREVFRLLWRREGWSEDGMDYEAWDRIAAVVQDRPLAVDLPGGIQVRRKGKVIQVGPAAHAPGNRTTADGMSTH